MTATSRGVSEVIGFILVFSIVLAGVGIVHVTGFDTLAEVSDREQIASAEQAFLVLSGSLDEARSKSVGRSVTLRLGDGRLRTERGPRLVTVRNGTTRTVKTGAMTYAAAGTRMTHASGAVLRSDGGDGVVLREPAMTCRPDAGTAVVSVTSYRPSETEIDSDGPVEVVIRPVETTVWRADRVSVNVSASTHDDAWGRYLERSGWNASVASAYACDADRIVVRRTILAIRFVF